MEDGYLRSSDRLGIVWVKKIIPFVILQGVLSKYAEREGGRYMKRIINAIWIVLMIAVSVSMIWYLLGSTACFQRGIDLVETAVFLIVWIPALLFVVVSFVALKNAWVPNKIIAKILLLIGIIVLSFVFIKTFIQYASPYGWLIESVTKDYIQTTIDEKYEYRLELVNIFQRNSYARLYIKDNMNGEEIKIPLDIPTREMYGISGGEGHITPEPEEPLTWSKLTPTDDKSVYILTTTDITNIFDRDVMYSYEIDIELKTAIRQNMVSSE